MTQKEALDILKTGANVFLSGEPGSGKTHTVNEYVEYLRDRGIEPAITASTGIAATHIGGMTIHSWSGIGIKTKLDKYELDKLGSSEYLVKRVGRAKVLIVDEVSMLSGNTLSMVDAVCREVRRSEESFGGLQVVLVGDFFQLPPIVRMNSEARNEYTQTELIESAPIGRFACDAPAWTGAKLIVCYLTEQYRQDDSDFLALLSSVRNNTFGEKHRRHIEKRKIKHADAPNNVPKLFSHNVDVDRVNSETLAKISSEVKKFEMSSRGPANLVAALKKGCLSPETLALKDGASVMFTKNSPREGFVNGTLGAVVGFGRGNGYPLVKTRNGRTIEVSPMDWTVEEGGVVRARVSQVPLRLAWAITVHKSQGMSLDAAVMDLRDVFEFGQGYVALSRVRRLSGLHLLGWNARAFEVHPDILAKDKSFREASEEASLGFADVPPAELSKMHENFVIACGGSLKKGMEKKKAKKEGKKLGGSRRGKNGISTYEETLAFFKHGVGVSEIAGKRGLSETTIISHVEKLYMEDKILKKDIVRIIPARVRAGMPEIEKAFKEASDGKLTPIFEKFAGKYSFEDLRLARMIL
ncbi:MAG: helix-turn-helix domain-containing protein [Patescibacteria group bacterium]